jgi:hypothetical protein
MKLSTHFQTNLYHLTKKICNIYIHDRLRRWRETPESEVAEEPAKSEWVPEEKVPSSDAGEMRCTLEEKTGQLGQEETGRTNASGRREKKEKKCAA